MPKKPNEFSTVLLTIDHTATRKDNHVVQKFVASTQSLTESMMSLFGYYEENHLLHSVSTIELFQLASSNPASAFVYRTKENVQVVMTAETFETVVAVSGGSVLVATSAVCDMAGEMIQASEEAAQGPVPLTLLQFETGPTPAEAEAEAEEVPGEEVPGEEGLPEAAKSA